MDKLFRKRTARKEKRAKPQAIAPLPPVPPSLDIDIRNSLILPAMSERFSVLLPSLSSASEISVRSLLEQQRARGQGPSLTKEEEELLMEEMRFAEEQQQQQQQQQYQGSPLSSSVSNGALSQKTVSAVSEWDGNPPPMEGDWRSVQYHTESSIRGSSSTPRLGSSQGTMSPRMSPSNSGNLSQGNYSSLDEFVHERSKMQGQSYGFSGNTSFRDNNYLLKVHKSQSKTTLDDYHDGLSSPSTSLRPPLDDTDGASSGGRLGSRRPSNDSHRTVTPQPTQQTAPSPRSASSSSLPFRVSPQEESARSQAEADEEMLAEEADVEDDAFMSPLTRAASTIKRNPSVSSQGRKRQSMLIGMSPAQAKRISVALFEIESHLRRSTLIEVSNIQDDQPQDSRDESHDREEILEGENGVADVDERAERGGDRRPSVTSSSGASSVFQYNASPISAHGAPSVATTAQQAIDNAVSPSPQAATLKSLDSASPASDAPSLPSSSPRPPTGQSSAYSHAASHSISSVMSTHRGHHASHSVSSTAYSEDSENTGSPRRPTLVPTRPQPARYTPSPSLGPTDYVPGQVRPVGSARQASISSRRTDSIGSPGATFATPYGSDIPSKLFPNCPMTSGRQSRSTSQPQTSASTSRSHTPTQGRLDHVPAPGVLASRHQQSNSFGDSVGWRSGSALAMYSPTRVISEADEEPNYRNGVTRSTASRDLLPQQEKGPSSSSGSLFPGHAGRADSVVSYGSMYVGPSDDDSPWNQILKEQEPPVVPGHDQDRADVELLKSMSGMGKEELSLIQGALVDKARNEQHPVYANGTSDALPTHSADATRGPIQPPNGTNGSHSTEQAAVVSPSPSMPDMAAGHAIGVPPQPVSREQLPTGPPPPRPQHPSDAAKETINESSPAAPGHDRSGSSGRKWIDDPPAAKRDIEERIANATSELFRAPSRGAHKRSLSKSAKKAISSPTLVSYSATVPTVPIAAEEKEKKKDKGFGGRKLSLRWKKKKPSVSGIATPQSANAYASTPMATPSPAATKSLPPTSAKRTPGPGDMPSPNVQSVSKPTASKGKHTPTEPAAATPKNEPPAQTAPSAKPSPTADINGFRFPGAAPTSSAERAETTQPVPERARTFSQVVELSRKTHKSTGSEDTVAIGRFFEAGRAIGLNDDQLQDMIRQNTRSSAVRSYHSVAPTTTSFSHSASASQSNSHSHSRSLSQSLQAASPISPAFGNDSQQYHNAARKPSPIAESLQGVHGRPESDIQPAVLRHTVVVADVEPQDVVASPMTGTASLQRTITPTSPTGQSFKRANSIRRKPIPLDAADRELVARSPISAHSRKYSETSDTFDLLPRPVQDESGAQTPQSAGDRSSTGMMNSSTQGSIYDYYSRDTASQRDSRNESANGAGERASQAIEITEYSDGRVVWNILNALRDEPNNPRGSNYEGQRESLADSYNSDEDRSRSSMTGSQRNSQREGELPWRLGPTPSLSFMRRPETRVYYTSSADVADLIDQLSTDVTGAARGRIDIRPQDYQRQVEQGGQDYQRYVEPGGQDYQRHIHGDQDYQRHMDQAGQDHTEHLFAPSTQPRDHDHDPAQFADAPSPFQQPRGMGTQPNVEAHERFAAAMSAQASALNRTPFDNSSGLSPHRAYGHYASGAGMSEGDHVESPSGASFSSDVSGGMNERSVEERLQALMDRLKAAPGGVGRGGTV